MLLVTVSGSDFNSLLFVAFEDLVLFSSDSSKLLDLTKGERDFGGKMGTFALAKGESVTEWVWLYTLGGGRGLSPFRLTPLILGLL